MMDKFASAKYRLGPGHRSIAHGYHTIEFLEYEFGEYAKYIALLHALIDNNILDRDYVESLVERADVDVTMEEVRLGK